MTLYRDTDAPFFCAPDTRAGSFSAGPGPAEELGEIRQTLDETMRGRYNGTNQSYQLWFGHLRLDKLDAEKAVFACENLFKHKIITERYLDFISDALEEVIGYRPVLEITVDSSLAPSVRTDKPAEKTAEALSEDFPLPDVSEKAPDEGSDEGPDEGPDGEEGWDMPEEKDFSVFADPSDGRIRVDLSGRIDENDETPPAPIPPGSASRPGFFSDPAGMERRTVPPLHADFPSPVRPGRTENEIRDPALYRGDYTFENFIVGSSNQMAHAAAVSVAENPGTTINPLFIWGASGLGKTHLMYAIANRAVERDPKLNVICVKGEEFMNEMIEAIRKDRNQAFRDKYRKAGMLLLDDIQFIAGKESTQTEFFHTFDALYEDKKQIIITSDRPPKELTALEDRIRSRFEAGLLVDIQPPDYELRMAILRDKINASRLEIPEEVIDFLAKNLQENIRQLEGVVKKLSLHHMVSGDPITMDAVLRTVPEYIRNTEPLNDTVARIIAAVADHYRVKPDDILGKDRKKNIQTARNVSMYLVRTVTGASFPQIGVFFYRDHSTVHSNVSKVESEIASDAVFEANVNEILKEIRHV